MDKYATKSNKNFDTYFELPNPGLRAYFSHVKEGQSDVYRTPFYKGHNLSSLLQEWERHLVPLKAKWPTLYEFEIDLGKKVGPMSVMKPLRDRLKDIDSYYDLISLDRVPLDPRAVAASKDEWKDVAGIRMRSQRKTMLAMKKSTNSGSPYFTKRRRVSKDMLPVYLHIDNDRKHVVQDMNDSFWDACAILGWRGQEGGPEPQDVKQRVVWMFPYAVNLKELQVYQPLIEAFQKRNLVPAWVGMDAVDAEITKLFDTKAPDDLVICTDFSKFDQHFNSVCQDTAKELLDYLFHGDREMPYWLNDVFPVKYMIPLAYDWEKLRFGQHGMGSGSGGTNADETLLHRTLQHEAAILQGAKLNPHSQCLGDDGILSYPGCTVDDVVSAYTRHGLEMNPDKQYVSKQDCTYLRRWHHQDYREDGVCVGVYATTRALGRLCMQERYYDPEVWSSEMVALRQLSILENVKYHPLREEFVSFCMKGDKYRLGLDIPGFLDNIEHHAQKAIEYMPDFLGYTRSLQHDGDPDVGISNWWIVKYLKSLA